MNQPKASSNSLFWTIVLPLLLFAPMALASGTSFTSKDHDFAAVTLASGLDRPWGMAFLPGDDGILITEKPGRVRLYRDGALSGAIGGGPGCVPLVAEREEQQRLRGKGQA